MAASKEQEYCMEHKLSILINTSGGASMRLFSLELVQCRGLHITEPKHSYHSNTRPKYMKYEK